jgi:hypothetical protein
MYGIVAHMDWLVGRCSVTLRTAATNAFLRMQDAARKDGTWLIPQTEKMPL